MKLIRFLSIISLTTFLSLCIISDASALENHVVPNGELGEFRHGTFPSPPIGDFTHVGVDIVAPCGSNIYAFADGKVKDIIDSTNDKNFKTLGYMVLIEHPASLIGKKFYTLYLHMQMPPEVRIGSQVTGGRTVIGNVGDTGKTIGGCHTHFEIRYFPERFSVWGNIYCPDDQRNSQYFKQNWEDPLTFFRKYPNRLKLVKVSGAEPTKQSPVYVAKDSRAYHLDRNCSKISTTDGLMEFSSPKQAEASGGILCEHCNPSAVKKQRWGKSLFKDNSASDLENLAVKIEDLPLGFKLKSALHIDNKSEAGSQGMMTDSPDEWLNRFRKWGRIDGYTVIFTRKKEQVFSSNEIFVSEQGASKAFRKMTANYQSEQFHKDAAARQESHLLRFEVRKIPTIGDESIMLSKNVKASRSPFTFVSMVVISWRRDKTRHSIMFMSIGSPIFDSDAIKLAELQDKRIQQQKEKNAR